MIGMHIMPMYFNESRNIQDRDNVYKEDGKNVASKKWLNSIVY